MHARRTALQAAALTAVLCLGALARPAPACAQSFFPESDALRPRTAVELLLSDLTEDLSSSSGGTGLASSELTNSLRRVGGRVRKGIFGAGAFGEQRRFRQTTDTFDASYDVDQTAAYGALVLNRLLTQDDALFLVLSTGRRHEHFAYDTYLRRTDANVTLQTGLVYRIGFLIAGYTQGQEELGLRVDDVTFDQEHYRFRYRAGLAGVRLGSLRTLGLEVVYQRKDTPAVAGSVVNLQTGTERLAQLLLVVGGVRLQYVDAHGRQTFTNTNRYQRDTTERELQLGVPVNANLVVGISQRRTDDVQDFTLLGAPVRGTSHRVLSTVRVELRF